MRKRNILILCHDFPYPPNHGGRYDMFYRIEAFSKLNFEIYAIFTIKEEPNKKDIQIIEKYVKRFFLKRREFNIFDFFQLAPHQVLSRELSYAETKHLIKAFDLPKYFNLILLEDFYVISIFEQLLKRKLINFSKILYRIHNNNFLYFLELAKTASLKYKSYYLTEAFKIFFFEKSFLRKYNPTKLFISYDDYLKNKTKENSFWLPAAVNIKNLIPYTSKNSEKFNVLFVGNLFTPNNTHGIRWFIKNVHPILVEKIPKYNLIIAGKSNEINPLLDLVNKSKKIKVFLNLPDLREIYFKSHIFINPIFFGAGVKIKNLDAIINGLPVVSTLKGNEGTGLIPNKHLLIAKNINDWVNNIVSLYKKEHMRKKITQEAQRFIAINYNQKEKLQRILSSLKLGDKIENSAYS